MKSKDKKEDDIIDTVCLIGAGLAVFLGALFIAAENEAKDYLKKKEVLNKINALSLDELQKEKLAAIDCQDYERAAIIRDRIISLS